MKFSVLLITGLVAAGCGASAGECKNSDDCLAGLVCSATNTCIARGTCETDGDCPSFERCGAASTCEPRPLCRSNAECGEMTCSVTGNCIELGLCLEGGDCDNDEVCSAGAGNVCLPAGECNDHEDCPGTHRCDGRGQCQPALTCGSESATASQAPANVLVVLDRSCTMRERVDGPVRLMKWEVAVPALSRLVDEREEITWGLELFPHATAKESNQALPEDQQVNSPACNYLETTVPIGPDGGRDMKAILNASLEKEDVNYPDTPCTTPIVPALLRASETPGLQEDGKTGAVLFVTDGKNTCGSIWPAVEAVKELHDRGITTYVVGFGRAVDPVALNCFADIEECAKCLDESNPNRCRNNKYADVDRMYAHAENEAELNAELEGIAGEILGCEYTLDSTPPDVNEIFVLLDGLVELPRDSSNGWSYNAASQTVSLSGDACERAKEGRSIDIVFGCPGIPVE